MVLRSDEISSNWQVCSASFTDTSTIFRWIKWFKIDSITLNGHVFGKQSPKLTAIPSFGLNWLITLLNLFVEETIEIYWYLPWQKPCRFHYVLVICDHKARHLLCIQRNHELSHTVLRFVWFFMLIDIQTLWKLPKFIRISCGDMRWYFSPTSYNWTQIRCKLWWYELPPLAIYLRCKAQSNEFSKPFLITFISSEHTWLRFAFIGV